MAARGRECRVCKWSNVELQQHAEVLVDEDDSFLQDLEKRALSREVVKKIKKELGKKVKSQPNVDTSVNKLRIKYKWLKDHFKITVFPFTTL